MSWFVALHPHIVALCCIVPWCVVPCCIVSCCAVPGRIASTRLCNAPRYAVWWFIAFCCGMLRCIAHRLMPHRLLYGCLYPRTGARWATRGFATFNYHNVLTGQRPTNLQCTMRRNARQKGTDKMCPYTFKPGSVIGVHNYICINVGASSALKSVYL